ncbi:RNA methyltransferase, putative [Plasmodium berghei]|uniref:RNA methyltransferase, putative n=2 Tax=Plasmodium berghei TaxID=5821 RepID=A0A509AJB0_PLABA|nr:RNA methyltransferase, putative [Plasmodium berghei ANKA]CXI50925.1 RNA methyltransferase, putative [Plasmodium berghei]SCL94354.1 RNA methyltransferase, putative [Plasmodium berghei]SCM15998.1 RNA methyltransferase, putative [Plasmodium berghei]SCM17794.1 RNA methyltransferase, putative [Plasmodium berghei]SCN26033.1 RNA methyltransferase, putative [Plasmodium berghei]|eukprot:XP_034421923.1 RNA methyltransferase, putative [Plasmodium berghei ANKA]
MSDNKNDVKKLINKEQKKKRRIEKEKIESERNGQEENNDHTKNIYDNLPDQSEKKSRDSQEEKNDHVKNICDNLPDQSEKKSGDGQEKEGKLKNENNKNKETDSSIVNENEKKIKKINEEIKEFIPKRIPNISRDLSVDVSVAIPATIINNKNDVIKSYISSYLARIFTIFSISKIYIYDDGFELNRNERNEIKNSISQKTNKDHPSCSSTEKNENNKKYEYSYLCKYLHFNLQYLETPQYLRKHIFPITNFLKHSGLMSPVDAPHHLRSDEWLPFREGVVIKKNSNNIIVDVGLFSNVLVENIYNINVGTRVTILFNSDGFNNFKNKNTKNLFIGKVIHPSMPKLYNIYWGYTIQILKNITDVFDIQVDCIIGTSERGDPIQDLKTQIKNAKSILIVFGNRDGVEDLFIKEREIKKNKMYTGKKRIKVLNKILKKFDYFINTCPKQTSRTIRTEEAISITLSLFQSILN